MGNLFAGVSLELLTVDAIDILTVIVTQALATTKHKGNIKYDTHRSEVLSSSKRFRMWLSSCFACKRQVFA